MSTTGKPDPRFLGGKKGVLTDARKMAFVIAFGWDGAVDIAANISKEQVAKYLRLLADRYDPPSVSPLPDADAS